MTKTGLCWATVAVDTHEEWQMAAVGGNRWKEADLDYSIDAAAAQTLGFQHRQYKYSTSQDRRQVYS